MFITIRSSVAWRVAGTPTPWGKKFLGILAVFWRFSTRGSGKRRKKGPNRIPFFYRPASRSSRLTTHQAGVE
jgi:hypothetical protein